MPPDPISFCCPMGRARGSEAQPTLDSVAAPDGRRRQDRRRPVRLSATTEPSSAAVDGHQPIPARPCAPLVAAGTTLALAMTRSGVLVHSAIGIVG